MSRKTRLLLVSGTLGVIVLGIVAVPQVYWYCRTQEAMSHVSVGGTRLMVNGKEPSDIVSVYGFNTFDSAIIPPTHADLGRIMDRSVADITSAAHAAPTWVVRTDGEGWDRLCAYWVFANGQLEICVGSGNDSDYVYCHFYPTSPTNFASQRPGYRSMLPTIFAR